MHPHDCGDAFFGHRGYNINKKANERKGGNIMKQHKFFAWATVFCFFMTMITGYQRK